MKYLIVLPLLLLLTLNTRGTPADDAAELAQYDAMVKPADREHWAFRPVRRPQVPPPPAPLSQGGEKSGWVRNPIDAFVFAKLQTRGWKPAAAAEPRQLLRRVFLDLIGMPPTIAEQEAFLKDSSPDALDRRIDDLLARPGYGERWGRHWLDLVRYAETNGYERDATKPNVWRYRDYVIRAFHEDKPYDRFVLEQLAGDELPDANAETLIASGFHRLGHWDDEPADSQEDRFDQLDDIVSTTSQVFLGLSIGCARCHNHKFEPLTVHDYYRLVAVFDPLQRPQNGRTELDLPAGTRADIERQAKRDLQIAGKFKRLVELRETARQDYLNSGQSKLPADALVAFWLEPAKRTDEQKKLVEKHSKEIDEEAAAARSEQGIQQIAACERRIRELREAIPDLPRGYFMHEPSMKPPTTHLLIRGKAARPGPEVAPGVPAVLVTTQPQFLSASSSTTERRLTLARWIASPDNPLTARVIVNRVWQFHFGEGLERTPSEFGRSGDPPTHPELLDWLADWFVHDAGWSLKKLHRLMMTSNAYRMNKQWNAVFGDADPENRFLWRQNYQRLEVEAIRDSMLAVSGRLNPKMYGPSMYPHVPKEALEGHSDPDKIWKPFDEAEASRRTVYAFIKRSMVVPMLEVLDLCDSTRSSAKRQVTTVAPQALSLFNGDFVNRQASHLADRLLREVGTEPANQIERAFRLALCRVPTPEEMTTLTEFLRREAEHLVQETADAEKPLSDEEAPRQSLEQLCRTILNLNEFVYAD